MSKLTIALLAVVSGWTGASLTNYWTARLSQLRRRLSVWRRTESNWIMETRITVAISVITVSIKNRG